MRSLSVSIAMSIITAQKLIMTIKVSVVIRTIARLVTIVTRTERNK